MWSGRKPIYEEQAATSSSLEKALEITVQYKLNK